MTSPRQVPVLTGEQLLAAAEERFGDHFVVSHQSVGPADYHLYVTPDGDREFTITHPADNLSVSLEATEEQSLELAAWLCSLLPAAYPRVVACDQGWLGHVDLTHGITPTQIRVGWVDHTEPGWDTGDPDFGRSHV